MSLKSIDALKNQFEFTFRDAERPGKNEIAEDDDWDKECIDNDFSEFLDKGFVPANILEMHAKSLPAFSPKAFVFFLKSYLNYAVENPRSELAEHLIYRFSEIDPFRDYWQSRLSLMTNDMFSLIIDCLSFIANSLREENQYLVDTAKSSIINLNNLKQRNN